MPEDQIFVEDLGKQFEDFWAVDGINLHVPAGNVLVLLGPNGAGKTTTIRMLTSILRPSKGIARVAGFDVVKQADQVRASVGVLTEHHGLYSRMNSEEYLLFYGQLYGLSSSDCQIRSKQLLDQFGLSFARKKRLGEYSKGMRQKLALVRAMLHDPTVLLLDEPTSAMDPESARMVRDAIQELRSGDRTILLCTHNLAEAEELADQIAIIRQGKIILEGPIHSLKADLMGFMEYRIRLVSKLDGAGVTLPEPVRLVERGGDWIRIQVEKPERDNPAVLACLANQGVQVITFEEIPQSLEQVYLKAINRKEAAQ